MAEQIWLNGELVRDDTHALRQEAGKANGFFTSLRLVQGVPILGAAHVERLRKWTKSVYDSELPFSESLILMATEDLCKGSRSRRESARWTVWLPRNGSLQLLIEARHLPSNLAKREAGIHVCTALCSERRPGNTKWVQRDVLDNLLEEAKEFLAARPLEVLLQDDAQMLSEGIYSNLFVCRDGKWKTPPLNGQILPGIARGAFLEAARKAGVTIEETQVTRQECTDASSVWLTNSLMGIAPVCTIDGKPVTLEEKKEIPWLAAFASQWQSNETEE